MSGMHRPDWLLLDNITTSPPHYLALSGYMSDVQLVDALEWCLDLGVTNVSVYAFSVDNFKRPAAEVATLMELAHMKLKELLTVRLSGLIHLLLVPCC